MLYFRFLAEMENPYVGFTVHFPRKIPTMETYIDAENGRSKMYMFEFRFYIFDMNFRRVSEDNAKALAGVGIHVPEVPLNANQVQSQN